MKRWRPSIWNQSKMSGFVGTNFSATAKTRCPLKSAWAGRPPCPESGTTVQCPFSTQPHPSAKFPFSGNSLVPVSCLLFSSCESDAFSSLLLASCIQTWQQILHWHCSSARGSGSNLMLDSCKFSVLGELCSKKVTIFCLKQVPGSSQPHRLLLTVAVSQGLEYGLPGFPKTLPCLESYMTRMN